MVHDVRVCTVAVAESDLDAERVPRWLVFAGVPVLLAAIALIKFTSTVVFALWLASATVLLLQRRQVHAAVVVLFISVAAFLGFWTGAGQPLGGLAHYLAISFEVASGYSAAMGQADQGLNVWIAVAALAFCAAASGFLLWRQRRVPGILTIAGFLFVLLGLVWRAGATRYGHWPIFFGFAAILPFAILCVERGGNSFFANGAATALCAAAFVMYVFAAPAPIAQILPAATQLASSNLQIMRDRRAFVTQRQAEWNAVCDAVHLPRTKAAIAEQSVDVLMVDQGVALCLQLDYAPRPVFQSYSAYTPLLSRLNEAYFAGAAAPRFVVLKLQPIDGRLPMQEDGLALLMIARRYRPRLLEDGYLLLERTDARPEAVRVPAAEEFRTARLGAEIVVASTETPILAFIRVRPSLWGRLNSLLLREPALLVELRTSEGEVHSYRLLRRVAESGFVLSPLIAGAADWLDLGHKDEAKKIASIRVTPDDARDWPSFDIDMEIATANVVAPLAAADLSAYRALPPVGVVP